jgi:hypothetical protein
MLKLASLAVMAALTACAAQTQTPPHAAYPAHAGVRCDIYATRTANGTRLEAVAQADRRLRGNYDFVITAGGSGGSSDIGQSGPVDLSAGRSGTIGLAEISNRHYRAVLTISDVDGVVCRREIRS